MESHYTEKPGKRKTYPKKNGSKMIIIGEVIHNILDAALQNVAQSVNGIDLHIFVLAESVQQRAVDVVVGVQVILGHAALFHSFP